MKYDDFWMSGPVLVLIALGGILGGVALASGIAKDRQTIKTVRHTRELDELSGKLQSLIEVEQAKFSGSAGAIDPKPLYDSAKWEADISVRIQYLRWQVEFLIALRSLEKPPGPGTRLPGRVIGDTAKPL